MTAMDIDVTPALEDSLRSLKIAINQIDTSTTALISTGIFQPTTHTPDGYAWLAKQIELWQGRLGVSYNEKLDSFLVGDVGHAAYARNWRGRSQR